MSIYAPDIIGCPSGTVFQENIRDIICMAPPAADPFTFIRSDIRTTINSSGLFDKFDSRLSLQPIPIVVKP